MIVFNGMDLIWVVIMVAPFVILGISFIINCIADVVADFVKKWRRR